MNDNENVNTTPVTNHLIKSVYSSVLNVGDNDSNSNYFSTTID